MEVKKDIGKAFREKLDSLDRQPGDALWDSISKDLDTKKKRKFPFFWLYIFSSSVVAIMLATYILTNIAGSDNDAAGTKPDGAQSGVVTNSSSPSANTENHSGDRKNSNDSSSITSANQNTTDGIPLTNTEKNNNTVENSSNTKNSRQKNSSAKNSSVKHTTTGGVANGTGAASKNKTNNATGQAADRTAVTSKNNSLKNTTATSAKQQQHKHYTTRTNNGSNSVTAKSGNTKKNYPASSYTSNNPASLASDKENTKATYANNGGTKTAANTKATGNRNTGIADKNNNKSATNASGTTAEKQNSNIPDSNGTTVSGSTTNEIGTKEIGTAFAHDSLPESIVAKDSLKPEVPKEDIAEEKKEENKKDSIAPKPFKKFSVFAYGGPSNFSFPNRTIVTDSTTSNINTSNTARYGVLFGYHLSNKLSIRTGFSLFNLKQSAKTVKLNYYMETTPVGGAQIMPPPDFTWIDYLEPFGRKSGAIIDMLGYSYSAVINIDRELSYVEVPLEINYDLFDKRFGITLTGGGSMLIQTKNEVFAYNENGRMHLGKWNAAAKTSFTGTLGLGLHYKFTPSLQLNAEPVFNYYFNTFKDSKPTSFTVRVGLQYNFDF